MIYISSEISLHALKKLSGPSFVGLLKILTWVADNKTGGVITTRVIEDNLALSPGIREELTDRKCLCQLPGSPAGEYRVASWVTRLIRRVPSLEVVK